ncbi:T9SS type A sorting domain-containing protein [Pontibacter burrus]|uniref:T9SS type A sorting domain-containing protein n=1 Tax=Pontibacter burrus TaxID=2704466 RepID=A0A6B3LND8_9BACT|nr:T9SS type A sorting domain-containing protein [Pontibacter burrus]NEM97413.1 T9SS type A sorting domain-containing protein [Pontibacter burrus]
MLINRINDYGVLDNTAHHQWQSELRTKGYPVGNGNTAFRKVALSNGAECGSLQAFLPGDLLFALIGKGNTRFLGDIAGMVAFPVAGNLLNSTPLSMGIIPGRNEINIDVRVYAINVNGGNMVYYNKITYKKNILYVIPVTSNLTNVSKYAPSGLQAYDSYPGGFYRVGLDTRNISSETNNDLAKSLAKYNINLSVRSTFNFVPTTSALDIGGGAVALTSTDHIATYIGSLPPFAPKSTPFDNFTTAFEDSRVNEEHMVLTARSGNWIVAELNNAPDLSPDCTFVCGLNPVTGPAILCSSSTYTLPNVPAGTIVKWSAVPAHLFVNSSGSGSSAFIEPVFGAGGQARITFTVEGVCDVDVVKNIQIGSSLPQISLAYDPNCNCSLEGNLNTGKAYDFYMLTDNPSTYNGDYMWVITPPMDSQNPFPMIFEGKKLTFTAMEPGYYRFQARQNYECGWSHFSEKTFYFTGQYLNTFMVTVYPNPTSEELNVTVDDSTYSEGTAGDAYQVVLYNSQQKVVYETRSRSKNLKISVDELREGFYYLKFIFKETVITKRIQISRRI